MVVRRQPADRRFWLVSRGGKRNRPDRSAQPVFWGGQAVPPQAAAFRAWTYAVTGAVMAGWGVFLAFVAQIPFRRRERWARNCMVLGVLVWYVPDTGASLLSGVLFNAAVNTVLLALTALPLIFTRRDFLPQAE
jgi:hypothetical protein